MLDKPTMQRLNRIEGRLNRIEDFLFGKENKEKVTSRCRMDAKGVPLGADLKIGNVPTLTDIDLEKTERDLLEGLGSTGLDGIGDYVL